MIMVSYLMYKIHVSQSINLKKIICYFVIESIVLLYNAISYKHDVI